LFTVQIANTWIEEYKRFRSLFRFVGKLLKSFYQRLKGKKSDLDSIFLIKKYLKVTTRSTRSKARAIIDYCSKNKSFTEEPIR